MNRKTLIVAAAPLLAHLTALSSATAEVVEVAAGGDAEAAINAAQPGDEIVLAGGMYTLNERFSVDIAGTAEQPIIIRAADGETPHLHRPSADQNIIDIDNADYVVIRGIEFSGGSAGIRISAANNLTIEDCEIYDTGDVALRANDSGTYESLSILRNHIHHTNGTGEGMYLGCNNDGCRIANSLIEGNYIHHTNQDTVEQGDGIEIKEGSYNNIVRDNVIHDTNYPCILTYSVVGNGAPNIIERNVMWNCGDHGIQSAADAIIRNNIILSSAGDGIAMQQHQAGSPSNLELVHNTILHASNDAISLRGTTGSVLIANNALYAQNGAAINIASGDSSAVIVSGNGGVGGVQGIESAFVAGDISQDFINGHYGGAPPVDLYPAAGSALIGAGDPANVVADDFNGSVRDGAADIGAYAYGDAENPGWPITAGFKDETSTPEMPEMPEMPEVPGDPDPGGCGCRTGGGSLPGTAWIGLIGLLLIISRRSLVRSR